MSADSAPPDSDTVKYVFGAGFVFGVLSTMLILGVVLSITTGPGVLSVIGGPLLISIGTAIVVTGIVGSALFLLAFPENRVRVPIVRNDLTEEFE